MLHKIVFTPRSMTWAQFNELVMESLKHAILDSDVSTIINSHSAITLANKLPTTELPQSQWSFTVGTPSQLFLESLNSHRPDLISNALKLEISIDITTGTGITCNTIKNGSQLYSEHVSPTLSSALMSHHLMILIQNDSIGIWVSNEAGSRQVCFIGRSSFVDETLLGYCSVSSDLKTTRLIECLDIVGNTIEYSTDALQVPYPISGGLLDRFLLSDLYIDRQDIPLTRCNLSATSNVSRITSVRELNVGTLYLINTLTYVIVHKSENIYLAVRLHNV